MRVALGVEYNGYNYSGWQKVSNATGVQEVLEHAISTVGNEPLQVICAGRTDAKVHAQGQVVHFEPNNYRSERSWMLGVNANLPYDVSVSWAQVVSSEFHARFSALSRSYRYVILNRPPRPAILDKQVTHVRYPLDVSRMEAAARKLIGRQDFSSFRAQGCQARSPIREVTHISVKRSGNFIYLDISANAFLYHMVRNIAGVLIAIGRGQQEVDWVDELLEVKNRNVSGVTAPPYGLYLVAVEYPDNFQFPAVEAVVNFG